MSLRKNFSAGSVIKTILILLFTLILAAVLCVLLIVAQPQSDAKNDADGTPRPSLVPGEQMTANTEDEIYDLVRHFPVSVLTCRSGNGMTFLHGECHDVNREKETGRIVTLEFTDQDNIPVRTQSIWPEDAFDMMEGAGWHFGNTRVRFLGGIEAVWMENSESVRLHIVSNGGLYTITVPIEAREKINDLISSLQFIDVPRN